MRVQKSASALTLALLVTSSLAIAVDIPPPAPTTTLAGPSSLSSSSSVGPPSASYTNQVPGSVDAPVDGLDGKPHTGPGLYDTREKGTGSVGISGGKTHVDLKKPPPHTGDHEIVGLDDLDGPGEPSADAKVCTLGL